MTSVSAPDQPTGSAKPTIPARALWPWLPLQVALNLAAATGPVDADAVTAQWQAMHDALSARPGRVPVDAVVGDVPQELAGYVAQLVAGAEFGPFAAEGWSPKLVDLRAVVAAQPCVLRGKTRLATLATDDLTDLAVHTLPLAGKAHLDLFVDNPTRPSVIKVASSDPNLRVMGFANGQPDGHTSAQVVGAVVGATASYMQVGIFAGRPILRDGYHRAVELLERGTAVVPALVRTIDNVEELFPSWQRPQLLPDATWLGDNPALLTDYLDDEFSATVHLPATSKAIVITISEVPWP
jgi:hypothetical protein